RKREQLEALKEREQLERALEVRLDDDTETVRLKREVEQLGYQIDEVRAELANEQDYLANLRRMAGLEQPGTAPSSITLTAPADGKVAAIFKGLRDYLRKAEVLMAISPKGAKPRIRAVFPPDALDSLAPGRTALLSFPDGIERQGVISDVYALSSQRKSVPAPASGETPAKVEAEIRPMTPEHYDFWEKYNDMPIRVRVRHAWFDLDF
ncbi:MAG: HlyD family efflux transporter periplasmic adaptor subunit, partial [Desulfovibrionaceae bacterium]